MQHFGEVDGAWPIGLGHPCVGCTEQRVAFRVPLHTTVTIERPGPPDTYPPIQPAGGGVSPLATGVAGALLGGLAGAGYVASRKLSQSDEIVSSGTGDRKDTPRGDL
jgi:hydrogenase small subunit